MSLFSEQIIEIISKGDFDKFIGQFENEYFDCKRSPYRIGEDSEKREFAKDVTSFANSKGGFILIGVSTKKSQSSHIDIVDKIHYLRNNVINIKQYFDVIKSWVFPDIVGIKIFWKESSVQKDQGIFIIKIPNQDDTLKPFLITKFVDITKISEILFGYAERKEFSSEPKDIRSIYTIVRDGLNYSRNIESRFSKLDSYFELSKLKLEIEDINNYENEISKRIEDIIKTHEIYKRRSLILLAYPQKPNAVNTIFEDKENSILRKLEEPSVLRYAGWDLNTRDHAKIYEGKFIQVCNGIRKVIRLYRDGNLLFIADNSYWAWPDEEWRKLNCVAIIEGIYNFISFYKEVVKDFSAIDNNIFIKWGCYNYQEENKPTYLLSGPLGPRFDNDKHLSPKNDYISTHIKINFQENDSATIAYQIIKEVYLWFGFIIDNNTIPYTKNINNITKVDTDIISNIH